MYAWVPREVQDKILSICAEHLTPNGVAYISYNTYPGWHMRGMIRDMIVYHSSGYTDPPTRIAAARAMLGLPGAVGRPGGALRPDPQAELDLLAKLPDHYLFHEHLEEDNQPLYFHQFAERAAAADLQYLGEAGRPTMGHFNFPDDVQQILASSRTTSSRPSSTWTSCATGCSGRACW